MDVAHSGGAQALVLVLSDVYSATLQQLLVELLQVPGGQLLQFDAADAGDKLLLIGAEDDVLWDTAKYIRRMEKRLAEKLHECEIETMVYTHGTHFVFPEGMLKIMLPVGSGLFVQLAFQAAKKYPKECRQTRIDIEKRMCRTLAEWKGEK